jgi:hypothetical protein
MVPHNKLDLCIAFLEEGLQALRRTPYHEVLGRDFLQQTEALAEYMVAFHQKATATVKVAALYFEMNGFTINPDRWYCDGFAYATAGGIWELEWLAHWDAVTDEPIPLKGMEEIQEAFAVLYCDETQPLSVKMAAELADHLVTARFMQAIAAAHGVALRREKALEGLPVLATAHDWDIVHETKNAPPLTLW